MNESTAASSPSRDAPSACGIWLILAAANLIWAGQGTAVKVLEARGWQPIAITFLPFYITTFCWCRSSFWQRRRNPNRVRPTWNDWWRFALAGVMGQVLAQLGMTWGIHRSLASNGAILNLLIPVITAVLASIMLHERLSPLRIACLVIGLVGVLLMSTGDLEQSAFLRSDYLLGNVLILVGCFGSSFYNAYCKGLLERFGEVEILIFSYITASLASVPLLVWVEPFDVELFRALDAPGWLAFGFLAVFMYGASMLLFFYVLEHLSVTVASASLYLVPVFGVFFAVTIVGRIAATAGHRGSGHRAGSRRCSSCATIRREH